MRYPFISSAPLPDALELSDAAAWVRIGGDDPMLYSLMKAAMLWAEGHCDQPLFERTFTVNLTDFTGFGILSGVNARNVTVSYDTALTTAVTLADSDYMLLPSGHFRFVSDSVSAIAPIAIRVSYTAGYSREELPEDIRQALLLQMAYFYDNRSNPVAERRTAAENLLQPYKVYSV